MAKGFAFKGSKSQLYAWDTMINEVYKVGKNTSSERELKRPGTDLVRGVIHPNGVREYHYPDTIPMGGHTFLETEANNEKEASDKFIKARRLS